MSQGCLWWPHLRQIGLSIAQLQTGRTPEQRWGTTTVQSRVHVGTKRWNAESLWKIWKYNSKRKWGGQRSAQKLYGWVQAGYLVALSFLVKLNWVLSGYLMALAAGAPAYCPCCTHLCCNSRKIASSSLGLLTPEAACKPVTLLESYSAPFHLPHHFLCHVELYGWLFWVAKAAKSKLRNEVLNEVLLNLLNHRVNPRLKSVTLTLIPRLNGYHVKWPRRCTCFWTKEWLLRGIWAIFPNTNEKA